MTWEIFTGYLYHKWPQIFSVYRFHNPALSSIMTFRWVSNNSSIMCATSETGVAYPSETPAWLHLLAFIINDHMRTGLDLVSTVNKFRIYWNYISKSYKLAILRYLTPLLITFSTCHYLIFFCYMVTSSDYNISL